MKTKVIAHLLAACMLLGLLAACSSSDPSGTPTPNPNPTRTPVSPGTPAPGAPKENFNPTGYPIVDEPITVTGTVFTQARFFANSDHNSTLYWTKMAENTNINVLWNLIDSANSELSALYWASNEHPDFYWNGLNRQLAFDLGYEANLFEDISELIYEWMPNLVSRFNELPDLDKSIRQIDGSIYNFPAIQYTATNASSSMYVRTDYLAQAGLAMPKTVDEFYNAAVALKEFTGGYAPIQFAGYTFIAAYFLGWLYPAFGEFNESSSFNTYFYDAGNGRVGFAGVSDQMRRTISFMAKLYDEGLLDRECFTMDPDTVVSRSRAGQNAFFGVAHIFAASDFPSGNFDFDFMPPVTSQWTNVQKAVGYPVIATNFFGGGVKKNSPYVREILRMIDIGYSKEEVIPGTGLNGTGARLGIEGVSYLRDHVKMTYSFMVPSDWGDRSVWDYVAGHYGFTQGSHAFDNDEYFQTNPLMYKREHGMYHNNIVYQQPIFPDRYFAYTQEENDIRVSRLANIQAYWMEMFARFVTCAIDVNDDAVWNNYVREMERMGLSQLLGAVQTAYDRWNSF